MHIKKILILICSLVLAVSPVLAQDAVSNKVSDLLKKVEKVLDPGAKGADEEEASNSDEEAETDGVAQVVLITPKDGQAMDLEEAISNYHAYMGDKEGARHYSWFSILSGPNTGKYIAHAGENNWADFDAEHDWDDEAADRFRSEVQPFIGNSHIKFTSVDKDLGMWPEDMTGYKYFSVTSWKIQPGKYGAFSQGLKKVDQIMKEGGWPKYYNFFYTVSGGTGNEIGLVSPRKSFADMAPPEKDFFSYMSDALGEEAAGAFLAEWGASYESQGNMLLVYRPDLSDYGQED